MKFMILSLSIIFLSSCSGLNPQTSQPIQAQNMPTVVSETEIPVETLLLTPTPVPISTVIDFPSWMSNPDTVVLAAFIREDVAQSFEIHFFNAATGNKFELVAPKDFGRFFWYDNMNFGLVAKDSNSTYKFNLQTGKVSTDVTRSEPTDDYWKSKKSLNKQYTAQLDRKDKVITVIDTKQMR